MPGGVGRSTSGDRSDDESVFGPELVPSLPGLYRARYQKGKITISYEASDCADAKPAPL